MMTCELDVAGDVQPSRSRYPTPPTSGAIVGEDGPYVTLQDGRWVRTIVRHHAEIVREPLERGGVEIAALGTVPSYTVPLRLNYPSPPEAGELAADVPLMAVADVHGEYEILVAFLRAQGIVDGNCNWAFGIGHVVFLGDLFDRGPHQMEVLWLLYKLEAEAAQSGGALHIVLGNHDVMVLRGDLRYLHLKHGLTATALKVANYSTLVGPDSVIGAWLRSKPAILRLGDLLFVHGGVSSRLAKSKLAISDINAGIRRALDIPIEDKDACDEQTELLVGIDGPLWYRGYFAGDEAAPTKRQMTSALKHFGATRVFVGHTMVKQVKTLYGGRVFAVHVYPRRDAAGAPVFEGASRIGGRWFRVDAKGTRQRLSLRKKPTS